MEEVTEILRIIRELYKCMYNLTNVDDVVNNGYCIGCMACMGMCSKGIINVKDGKMGFLVPIKYENCDNCGNCLSACPSKNNYDN